MSGLNDAHVQRPLDDQHEGGAPAAPPDLPGDADIDLDELVAAYGRLAEEIEADGARSDRGLDDLGTTMMQAAWALHQGVEPPAWEYLKGIILELKLSIPIKPDKKTLTLLRFLQARRNGATTATSDLRDHLRLTKRLSRIAIAVDRARMTSFSSVEAEAELRDKGVVCLSRDAAKSKRKPADGTPEVRDANAAEAEEGKDAGDDRSSGRSGFVIWQVEVPEGIAARLVGAGATVPVRLKRAADEAGRTAIQAAPWSDPGDEESEPVAVTVSRSGGAPGTIFSHRDENQEQSYGEVARVGEDGSPAGLSISAPAPPSDTTAPSCQKDGLPPAEASTIPPASTSEGEHQPAWWPPTVKRRPSPGKSALERLRGTARLLPK